jgi:hypothetical protein
MRWRAWRFVVVGTLGVAACAGCATSRDDARRDTLFVGHAGSATAATPGNAAPSAADASDSLALRMNAFVGFTQASGASATLPQLAVIAADGRRAGFDPATGRTILELSGADYSSEAVPDDDDDASPRTPASISAAAPAESVMDVRVLNLPVHAGDAYTFVVAAESTGTFDLNVNLSALRGDGTAPHKPLEWRDGRFAIRRGEVRRLVVRIGDGTLDVRADTSAH